MKIDAIEIYHVKMPLIQPFKTAFGADDMIESVLIKMVSGNNYGWGESASWRYPAFSTEFAEGQFLVSKEFLAPSLVGRDIDSGCAFQEKLAWCIMIFKDGQLGKHNPSDNVPRAFRPYYFAECLR